jgi:hypothetical protein
LGGQALYEATRDMFAYFASMPDVIFMTCNEYIGLLNKATMADLS